MILMRANNPFRGPLEGVTSENRDLSEPWNGKERSKCHLGSKKSWFSRHTPYNGSQNGRAKKVSIFRAHPFQWFSQWMRGGNRYDGTAPTLLPRYKVYSLLGETHLLAGKGAGDPIPTKGQKLWGYVYYSPSTNKTMGWEEGELSKQPFVRNNLEINSEK